MVDVTSHLIDCIIQKVILHVHTDESSVWVAKVRSPLNFHTYIYCSNKTTQILVENGLEQGGLFKSKKKSTKQGNAFVLVSVAVKNINIKRVVVARWRGDGSVGLYIL